MKDKQSPQQAIRNRRIIIMIVCILMCAVVLYAFLGTGDIGFINDTEAKAYVLGHHTEETGAENAVTAVYLNYRLWDTIFEAMLLLLSALAVISFSWSAEDEK